MIRTSTILSEMTNEINKGKNKNTLFDIKNFSLEDMYTTLIFINCFKKISIYLCKRVVQILLTLYYTSISMEIELHI